MTFDEWFAVMPHPAMSPEEIAEMRRSYEFAWNAAMANVALPEEAVASNPAMMGEAMFRDAMRYRWLRNDSKVLETEQRKATIVEVYQGKAMDEQIDKAMGTYSEPQQNARQEKP